MNSIYLDHNATSGLLPEAFEALLPFLRESYGNPSSIHRPGVHARAAVEQARAQVATALAVRPAEVSWTSGGTESINWALRGALEAQPKRRRVVVSAVEHSATLDVCERLEKHGVSVTRIGVDGEGRLDHAALADALDDDVAILSVLAENNETGVLFDVDAIGDLAHERGIPFHVDAVQAVGKGFGRLNERPIDFVSFSGHKFGAPKGIGGLYLRRGSRLRPLIWGGHHERGRRGGTENVPGIVGMGAAIEASERGWASMRSKIAALRDELQDRLVAGVPDLLINGSEAQRNAQTLNVCFPGIEGAAVVLSLSQRGIHCSSGSACTASDAGPSHVLAAMKVANAWINGSVRLSLGLETSASDIAIAAEEICAVYRHVARVRA